MSELVLLFRVLFSPCFDITLDLLQFVDTLSSQWLISQQSLEGDVFIIWFFYFFFGVIEDIQVDQQTILYELSFALLLLRYDMAFHALIAVLFVNFVDA